MGLNQFHDILPGSAIAWVHRQARADYVRDIARLRDIAAEAGASIASVRDDADMRSNAAIVPYTAKNGDSWIARTAAVGTQDDDANGTDAVADESTIATTCDDGRIILDNGLLRAIIAPDGTVRSLIDLDNGHELVPDGSGIGHYELLRDEPYEWDAWDIQRDAFLSAEGIDDSHVERVTETKRGGATVHVSSTTDGVSIDACITLRAKSKSLEFRTKVDWRASERFLKVDIPMAIQADRAQYECQYGMVERPIQKNTRSDEAKYESCTHRFVRVADAGYAAAVVNASTYGSDVSPIHRNTASGPVRGTMIRLSLLSSPLYPDPNTDKGVHEFAWNVVADASMPAVLDEANRLNAAVLPAVPAFDPLAQLNPVDGVMVLDWVKLADDGSGDLILRVYEAVGGEAHARLAVNAALGKATVRECSIMEDARLDAELPHVVADHPESLYIVQHWRGWLAGAAGNVPDADTSVYANGVLNDVYDELMAQVDAVLSVGVKPEQVIIDPGLGFSKPGIEHNLPLLAGLERFNATGHPVLVGASRKRFIGAVLAAAGVSEPTMADRDNATASISALSAEHGAWAVRVHDVARTRDAIAIGSAWRAYSK